MVDIEETRFAPAVWKFHADLELTFAPSVVETDYYTWNSVELLTTCDGEPWADIWERCLDKRGTCAGGHAPASTTRQTCEGAGTCTATADGSTRMGLESECVGIGSWVAGPGVFTTSAVYDKRGSCKMTSNATCADTSGMCDGGDDPMSTSRVACEGAGTCTAADGSTTVGLQSECAALGIGTCDGGDAPASTARSACESVGTCATTADGSTTVGLESECNGGGSWVAGPGVFTSSGAWVAGPGVFTHAATAGCKRTTWSP